VSAELIDDLSFFLRKVRPFGSQLLVIFEKAKFVILTPTGRDLQIEPVPFLALEDQLQKRSIYLTTYSSRFSPSSENGKLRVLERVEI
jgi:hypothetical protein